MSTGIYFPPLIAVFDNGSSRVLVQPRQPLSVVNGSTIQIPFAVFHPDDTTVDLTGAAVVLTVRDAQRNLLLSRQATLTSVSTGVGYLQLNKGDTSAWAPSGYSYDLWVLWGDGSESPVIAAQAWNAKEAEHVTGDPVMVLPTQQPLGQAPISTTPQPGTQSIWVAGNALWINGGGQFGGEVILSQNGVPLVTLFAPNGISTQAIRFQRSQGGQISSGSATIAPGTDGDSYQATGHGTNILQMITTGFQAGGRVAIEFVDTTPVTIKHMGAGVGATTAPFFLAGSVDLVTTGRSCQVEFELKASGGNFVYWREVSRSLG